MIDTAIASSAHSRTIGGSLMPNTVPMGELKVPSHAGMCPLTWPPFVHPSVAPVTRRPWPA